MQRRILSESKSQHVAIHLTAYWTDPSAPPAAGRETLAIELGQSLGDLVGPRKALGVRNLGAFRIDAVDHLVLKTEHRNQAEAQRALFAVARALRFMAHTGLRASTNDAEHRRMERCFSQPGHDHPSYWRDPSTNSWVHLDEPYTRPVAARAAWAEQQGLHLVVTEWEGLYSPGSTTPFLVCQHADVAQHLQTQLASLQASLGQRGAARVWDGESAMHDQPFVSPARQASLIARRARPASAAAAPSP